MAEKRLRDIWVFGDSLTSPYYSWTEKIDDAGYARLRNTSRGGLRMVDVIMPEALPPYVEGDAELIEIMEPYRAITEQISYEYDNVQLLDIPYPSEHLLDRVHQSERLHFWQAVYMMKQLDLGAD